MGNQLTYRILTYGRMQKRTFLKLSSAMLATPFLKPFEGLVPGEKFKNWAGNLTYSTDKLAECQSVANVQELVKKYPKLKVLGTRHCFNTIADSTDQFLR